MATLAKGPVWLDHVQEERTYSLRHLRPAFISHTIPAVQATPRKPGRAEITIKVRISYSHHCFTNAVDAVAAPNPDHYYNCQKRPNEIRVFCPIRWQESQALPSLMSNLKKCYFTRHHNYFVWRNPTSPNPGEYFVYFAVRQHAHGFVDLEVESAYLADDGPRRKKDAREISLNALFVNTINGRRPHPAP